MTVYVLKNKTTGTFGLGIKLLVPQKESLELLEKYTISLTTADNFIWALKSDDDQPFVVIFDHKIMDQIEILGEL